jgi:hypothetical protein
MNNVIGIWGLGFLSPIHHHLASFASLETTIDSGNIDLARLSSFSCAYSSF